MIKRFVLIFFSGLLSMPALADVLLKPNPPSQYTVVKGDTLWDISGKFLQQPWHWPEIWYVNPQIKNPHLIYPGDVISLSYELGKPVLTLSRGTRTVKLSPDARATVLDKPITTIDAAAIAPFLTKPRVMGEEVWQQAPYVVATPDERIIVGVGDYVYVKDLPQQHAEKYQVYEKGDAYIDPQTQELLGYEAIYSADASVLSTAEVAKVVLQYTSREVEVGHRLFPVEEVEETLYFLPSKPEQTLSGQIISIFDGVSQVGQYQVVVINLGARDGLKQGHVLSLYKAGRTVVDRVSGGKEDTVTLPDEHIGEAMIFKYYDKVSYALIMRSSDAVHLFDKVRTLNIGH